MKSKCSEALIVEKFDDPVMFVHVTPHVCDLSDIFSQPKTCVPLSKRPKHQLRRKNRTYFNNLKNNLKNKEITLAHGLTSVKNRREINVNRTKNN